MSKPLHLVTRMDLECRGLDFEANVALDYFRPVAPIIHTRREDCEPGNNAYCSIRSVDVIAHDASLPRFTPAELFQAAGDAADRHIDSLGVEAERDGYVEVPPQVTEGSMRIFPLPKPQVCEPVKAPLDKRELVGPSV